ncbi:hypothetical protein CHLRE_15g639136v5 [Chlamydomonas reinhardtii]|uniref:Uncharacterized protein n=1 Tax=Chlamydomonas reinhardtii TaxID=3055 RepID=A0A2K3CWQ6_CHLRE|nr:uncharacterized protein CHLRE_15g639136v5 [Chlamydomonas reinhardtii]PNW72722.1 hypothetical protein CHLRE_15g639136v5 [Chlamydomonas reinhardtii]
MRGTRKARCELQSKSQSLDGWRSGLATHVVTWGVSAEGARRTGQTAAASGANAAEMQLIGQDQRTAQVDGLKHGQYDCG